MTLSGRSLALRLSADQEETAHRLRNDHDELSRILHRAGYETDLVSIQSRQADSSPPAQNTTSQTPAQGGGAPAQGQAGREQRQPQGGAPWQSPDSHTGSQSSNESVPPRDRPAGGLYV
jgi:hypothetical protein